jgi:hypothetical protein
MSKQQASGKRVLREFQRQAKKRMHGAEILNLRKEAETEIKLE